jgi:hypothetical protein
MELEIILYLESSEEVLQSYSYADNDGVGNYPLLAIAPPFDDSKSQSFHWRCFGTLWKKLREFDILGY